jgi:hypothetical protein
MRVRKKAVRSWYARKTMFDVRTSRLVSAAMVSALVSALAFFLVNKMLVNKLVNTETKVSKMLVSSLVSTQTAIGGWINKALVNSEVNKEKAYLKLTVIEDVLIVSFKEL